jgi:hypothetical protein
MDTTTDYRFSSSKSSRTVTRMSFDTTPRSFDSLAWRIAHEGIDGSREEVREFARVALANGVAAELIGVLLDSDESPVARQRAFGMAAAHLANRRSPTAPAHFIIAA